MEKHKNEYIKRTKRRDNFVVVGNEVIQDDRITIEARGVLVFLLSLPQDWVIRKSDLQKRLKVSRRTIDRCFDEMKQCGYLCETDFVKKDGKFDGKGYIIYDYSIFKTPPEMYSTDAHGEQRESLTDVHSEQRTDAHGEQLIKNKEIQQRTNINTGEKTETEGVVTKIKKSNPKENRGGTIEERKLWLKKELEPFVDKYGREMLNEFFTYWTEPNDTGTKIRMDKQEFFNVPARLATWKKKSFDKFGTASLPLSSSKMIGVKF